MNLNKKYLIIFLLFPFIMFPQGTWQTVQSPTDKALRALTFIDSLNGWIAGDSSFIFKTTDGAASWEQIYQNDEYDIYDIFFLDNNYGWAVAAPIDPVGLTNALLLNTSDGGETWTDTLYPPENIFFNSVFYFDSANGWMGGNQGNIAYTTNAGERWHLASIDTGVYSHFDIHKIKFYNESYGVASGGHFDIVGLVWISRDGGQTWQSQPVAPDIITDFHFYDSLHIIGITKEIESYGSGLVRTTDGGATWVDYQNFPYFGPGTSMAVRVPNEVWVTLSTSQTLIYSLDSGYTWLSYNSPGGSSIIELQFVDSLLGFGVGEFGAIIRYGDSVTSVKEHNDSYAYNLYQNYPNPFNPESVIEFEISEAVFVKLTVFDILGNEVQTLVNELKPAGIHKAVFNASVISSLTSGIYFYRLNAGDFSSVKKMIYLK